MTDERQDLFNQRLASVLEEQDRRLAGQASILLTAEPPLPAPDETARLSRALSTPPHVVAAAPDVFRAQEERARLQRLLETAPVTARWLMEQQENGALARDDVENLTALERIGRAMVPFGIGLSRPGSTDPLQRESLGATAARRGQQFAQGATDTLAALPEAVAISEAQLDENVRAQAAEQIAERQRQVDAFSAILEGGTDPASGVPLTPEDRALYEQRLAEAEEGLSNWIDRGEAETLPAQDRALFQQGDRLRQASEGVFGAPDPRDTSFWAQAATGAGNVTGLAVSSGVATMVAGPAGGLAVGAAQGASMNAAQVYEEALASGASEETAREAAEWGALIGSTEIIPINRALKLLPPRLRQVAGDAFNRRLLDIAQGAGEEVAQEYAAQVANNLVAQGFYDPERGWNEGATQAALVGAVLGGGVGAVGTAVEAVAGRAYQQDAARASRAGETAATLDQIDAVAGQSALRRRSPEAFEAFSEAQGLADQAVYVPAEGLRELFQAKDLVEEDALAAWGLDPATFEEAVAAGRDVGVPLSVYAARISGTEDARWFRENGSMNEGEMSLSAAERFNAEVQDSLDRALEEAEAQWSYEQATRASDLQVYDTVYSQLREAGRTPDVAKAEAVVWQAFFRTQAARTGEDALELARSMPVAIRGPQTPERARARGALDIALNTLRGQGARALRPRGPSLLSWIASKGGLRDEGGDVAAMDPPKGVIGESFEEAQARKAQPTLGGLPAAAKGWGLDELGRMAREEGFFPELGSRADVDEAALILEAIAQEMGGEPVFRPGDGPDESLSAIAAELSRRGIDLSAVSNDEAVAALEAEGRTLNQSEDGAVAGDALADERLDQAVALKAIMDRSGLSPEQLADVLEGVALLSEADRLGRIPALAPVLAQMRRAALEDPQVLDAVVGLVPVDVVNGLFGSQGAAKVALHDQTVLEDGPAFDADLPVAGGPGDAAGPVRLLVVEAALRAAEVGDVSLRSRGEAAKGRAAVGAGQGQALRQGDRSNARASITFPAGGVTSGQTIINLFEGNNLSSLLHESGHFFLEAFTALANAPEAPRGLRDDLAAIRTFLGAKDGEAFTTEQHETWARGFEAYLLEGQAPSLELADAFARFKAWLTRIYRSLRGLNVKLNPEIRDVMDRLLATDAEIAAARESQRMNPLFADQAAAGMAEGSWRIYQRMARRSAEEAAQALLAKTMAKVRREREAWWKEERARTRDEIASTVNTRREHRLVELMANGRWIGSEKPVPDMQLSRDELVEVFGEGVLGELGRPRLGGKRAIYAKGGVALREAAEFFGFASPEEMVRVLQNTGRRRDAIEAETDRVMADRYGDPLNDGSIEEEALAAIHSEQQAQTVAMEARTLASRAGRPVRDLNARVFRQRARLMLGRMTVREATRPEAFLAAGRQAAKRAEDAFARVAGGDAKALEMAARHKEQQLLNHYLYLEARDAKALVDRKREAMRAYGKKSVRAKLDGGYIEQIDAILEDYDFRARSQRQVARAESLRAFVSRMEAEGRAGELAIDERLLEEARRRHYSRLSLDELRGLFDTIDNIDHLGRMKRKLLDARAKRDLEEVVGRVAATMDASLKDNPPALIETRAERLRDAGKSFLNLTLNADTLLREIDGFADLGDAWTALKQPIDEGMARLTERRIQAGKDVEALYEAYSLRDRREMARKRAVPELGGEIMSKWDILAIALNAGNQDNFERLTNPDTPRSLTPDQVRAVLATLDERDWRFVQGWWDYLETFWPEIAAKQKRQTGLEPKKVAHRLMVDAPGFVTGGYWPIKYSSRLSFRATENELKDLTDQMRAGRFGKAQTANGHTKERVGSTGMALDLDLAVGHLHVSNVLYDLELGEAVNNSWRILSHERVRELFRQKGRRADHEALEVWLQDVAAGDRALASGALAGLRHLRTGFTVSRLAFNVATAALQPTGLAQSAVVVGKGAMMKGLVSYLRSPRRWARDVAAASPLMRERRATFERDMMNALGDIQAGPMSGWETFKQRWLIPASFFLMQKVQYWLVDLPTWVAAYEKELGASSDEARARLYADTMVKRAQGSGLMSDRGMIERGTMGRTLRQSELPKLFTMLASYLFAKGNVAYEKVRGTDFKDPRQVVSLAGDLALLFAFEAVATAAIKGNLPGEEEDEPEEWALWLARETSLSILGTLPFMRDLGSAISGFSGGGAVGAITGVMARFLNESGDVFEDGWGVFDSAWARSALDVGGMFFSLPSAATNNVIRAVTEEDRGLPQAFGFGTGQGRTLADLMFGE